MRTNQDVTLPFRIYGNITIPKGTKLTHETAMGFDAKHHFVDEFNWILKNYPTIKYLLMHDAKYYGIDIPKEYVDYELDFSLKDENL
ncbi:MAG: hypothetical protein KAY50_00400 [Chitinophagaceae bacterium]|nr:hypothetical protein [Chitinophagaceae bacterium]